MLPFQGTTKTPSNYQAQNSQPLQLKTPPRKNQPQSLTTTAHHLRRKLTKYHYHRLIKLKRNLEALDCPFSHIGHNAIKRSSDTYQSTEATLLDNAAGMDQDAATERI